MFCYGPTTGVPLIHPLTHDNRTMSSDNESIHGHEDDLEGDFEDLTNAADAKDLFGSDSDSEIDSDRAGDSKSVAQPSQISEQDVDERELFGDDDDDDIEKVHVEYVNDTELHFQ